MTAEEPLSIDDGVLSISNTPQFDEINVVASPQATGSLQQVELNSETPGGTFLLQNVETTFDYVPDQGAINVPPGLYLIRLIIEVSSAEYAETDIRIMTPLEAYRATLASDGGSRYYTLTTFDYVTEGSITFTYTASDENMTVGAGSTFYIKRIY